MRTIGMHVLAAALFAAGGAMSAQDAKSPDLQQQSHPENNPPPQANQPNGQVPQPSTSQSPDTEQEKSSQRPAKGRKRRKSNDDAHQAHGTPHPEKSTDTKADR